MVDSGQVWWYHKFSGHISTNFNKGRRMYFLTGEYDHQIDAKNRIRIPNKLKGEENKLRFAKGPNNCIYVYYEEAFQDLIRKIQENTKQGDEKQRQGNNEFREIGLCCRRRRTGKNDTSAKP